VSYCICC